jgi:hypothetical protein
VRPYRRRFTRTRGPGFFLIVWSSYNSGSRIERISFSSSPVSTQSAALAMPFHGLTPSFDKTGFRVHNHNTVIVGFALQPDHPLRLRYYSRNSAWVNLLGMLCPIYSV